MQAYHAGDLAALKGWCTESAFEVFDAQIGHRNQAGMRVDFKILDLRNVEVC